MELVDGDWMRTLPGERFLGYQSEQRLPLLLQGQGLVERLGP